MSPRTLLLIAFLAAGCAAPYAPPGDPDLAAEAVQAMRAANAAADRNDWPAAIDSCRKARRLDPRSHLPLYGLARACDSMGGRDVIAVAYYRAYLAALPAGEGDNAGLILTRIGELDRHAAAEVDRMVAQARRMADLLAPDIWQAPGADRDATLRTLDAAMARLRDGLPPDGNRAVRGQPSALAAAEIDSWVKLAEDLRQRPSVEDPASGLRSAASAGPESAVSALATLADTLAAALAETRTNERTWQGTWAVFHPGR